MRYHGHKQEVQLLLPLGDQLISSDCGGDVIVWDVQGGGECVRRGRWGADCSAVTHHALLHADIYLQLKFDPLSFAVSAIMHPSTYLNKVLLGSSQGALQLWNIKSR